MDDLANPRVLAIVINDSNMERLHFIELVHSSKYNIPIIELYSISKTMTMFSDEHYAGKLSRIDLTNLSVDYIRTGNLIVNIISYIPNSFSYMQSNYYTIFLSTIYSLIHSFNHDLSSDDKENGKALYNYLHSNQELIMFDYEYTMNPRESEAQMSWLIPGYEALNSSTTRYSKVELCYICDEGAIPIVQRTYRMQSYFDPSVVTSLLSTLSHFVNIKLRRSIDSIHFGRQQIIFKWNQERTRFYILGISSDFEPSIPYIADATLKQSDLLLETMEQGIEILFENDIDTEIEIIEEMVDELVFQSFKVI